VDKRGTAVEVWLVEADAAATPDVTARLQALLGPDERARISVADGEAIRVQRLVGYALRRAVLGRALGLAPAAVPLRLSSDGVAEVVGAVDLAVSLSHSGGLAAVAVARGPGACVGVDVELVRPRRDVVGVAARFFHPDEAATLAGAPAAARTAMFFELWTRKESLAKATGRDLFSVLPQRARSDGYWRVASFAGPPRGSRPPSYVGAVSFALASLDADFSCPLFCAGRSCDLATAALDGLAEPVGVSMSTLPSTA
jgi:4'-phosphopantetheinyl transferase